MTGPSHSGGGTPDSSSLAALLARARLRVVVAFVLVAIGLATARAWPVLSSAVWFSAGIGCCGLAVFARGWACRVVLGGALVLAAGGWMQLRVFERAEDELAEVMRVEDGKRVLVTVEGVVLGTPRVVAPRGQSWSFLAEPKTRLDVDVESVITDSGVRRVSGKVWVRVTQGRGGAVACGAGDRVRVTGWFEGVPGPQNPGEDDLRLYAAQVGVSGSISTSSAELVEAARSGASSLADVRGWWLRWRAMLEDRSRSVVARASGGEEGDPARGLLQGLVLGDYDPGQQEVRDVFARQGLAHVLSISGFHLSVMALMALVLLRLTGDRGWVEPLVVAAVVLLYLMIVPASSPVLRSAAMVLVIMGAEASGRRYDRLTLLGWIAIGLLAWRPLDLWSVGFQLSLGLTATLFWLAPVFHARLWGERIKGLVKRDVGIGEKVLEKAREMVSTGVLCWLVSLPLVMLRFGIVSPLAIVTTVVVTPLVVVILWIGYAALLVGVFVPAAADAAGAVLHLLGTGAVRSVQLLDSVGWSAVRVPVVSALWAAGATAVVVFGAKRGNRRDWRAWAAICVVVGWFGWHCFASGPSRDVALRVDTFSVGNGTCHLMRSGREAMLWDCGPMKGAGAMPPLVSAVRELGAWRTPVVVITHPDIDHFGGLLEVVEPLGVETVLVGQRFVMQAEDEPASAAATLVKELERRGIEVRAVAAGEALDLGAVRARFVSPPAGAEWKLDNDQSLVAVFGMDGNEGAVLMTGDVQDEAIGFLAGMRLWPRVLELPHHGSARPAAIGFAASLNPEVVLQSTGDLRASDPRWAGVRDGRVWFTTCTNGASWVEVMEDGRVRCGSIR